MQGTILAETEAFITKQREALLAQRADLSNQQKAIQTQIIAVDRMLEKFDVFGGKARQTRGTRRTGTRRGSKRDALLKVIKEGGGLSRGQILEKMGLKGDKSGEMSVSNALTALTKANQVRRDGGKYHVA